MKRKRLKRHFREVFSNWNIGQNNKDKFCKSKVFLCKISFMNKRPKCRLKFLNMQRDFLGKSFTYKWFAKTIIKKDLVFIRFCNSLTDGRTDIEVYRNSCNPQHRFVSVYPDQQHRIVSRYQDQQHRFVSGYPDQ